MSDDSVTLEDFNFTSPGGASPQELIDAQIAWLTKQLAKKQKQKKQLKSAFPKPYKLYLYSNKEDCYDAKKRLGLSADVDFFPAYEVCLEGTVDEDGTFTCYSINGSSLVVAMEL